jgi:hypothetical protein
MALTCVYKLTRIPQEANKTVQFKAGHVRGEASGDWAVARGIRACEWKVPAYVWNIPAYAGSVHLYAGRFPA